MALGKGIPVINGFDLNSKLPLDSRAVVDTKEEMNALVINESVGDGQLCYCKADKKLYVLEEGTWSEVGGGGGGKSVPPTLNLVDMNSGEIRTSITEEEKTNLDNGLYNQVVYMQDATDYLGYQLPTKLIADTANEAYSFATFSADSLSLTLTGISLVAINIGEKDETTNTYPITFDSNQIALPGADTRTVILFNRPNQILAPNDGGADIILPCTTSDNGKVLSVVNGEAQWANVGGSGSNINKLDIEFTTNGNTTLTSEQVTLIKSYANQYVYVKLSSGIAADNAYIGYVFDLGDLGTFISIVSQPNISGNIIIQSLISIQGTTATHKENTIVFSNTNSDKFLKTNAQGEPEWASISTPTITFED